MVSTHLRKKDDPNKSYLYAYTEMLAMQPDMIPCDERGNPVGVAGEIVGSGMRPRQPEAPSEELKMALDAIKELKAEIENLKKPSAEDPEEAKDEDDPEETEAVSLSSMPRNDILAYLKSTFGEKAKHLKVTMGKERLLHEGEKLQASADM